MNVLTNFEAQLWKISPQNVKIKPQAEIINKSSVTLVERRRNTCLVETKTEILAISCVTLWFLQLSYQISIMAVVE